MIIRKARESDLESISLIYNKVREQHFPWIDSKAISEGDIRKDTDGEEITVAEIDNLVVGFISIWEPDNFIHHLFVSLEYQTMGVGSKLMEFVEQSHPSFLRLKCVAENKRAIEFYKKR